MKIWDFLYIFQNHLELSFFVHVDQITINVI